MTKNLIIAFLICLLTLGLKAQDISQNLRQTLDTLSKEVPGLNEYVDFTLVNAPLTELLRAVAETHQLNVNLGHIPEIMITNNFTQVKVSDLILYICNEYEIEVRFVNNIFTFYHKEVPIIEKEMVFLDYNGNVSLDVQNKLLSDVAKDFTQKTGLNILVHQSAQNSMVNGFLQSVRPEKAIEIFAEANNLKIENKGDGIYQIELDMPVVDARNQNGYNRNSSSFKADLRGTQLNTFRKNGAPFVSLSCFRTPVADILKQVCDQFGLNYLLLAEPNGTMSCHLDSVSFEVFLNTALESSNLAYTVDHKNIFVIGEDKIGSLAQSIVYSFLNRSVEGVDEIIPQGLLSQVQIKPFKDLNALIITGSELPTARLLDFLKQIDRPVPNILIEVMVVEVRKGSSVKTGIKAFLGDSVPNTSGQLFSGVDLTLSSASFNRILNNLDSRGIMNLGRVTPKFYATVQAMEENNDLNIRSTPKLSTLNGHEATMTIGQSVYYLIETQNVTGGVNPIVTVTPRYEKVEANLDLKITPFVSDLEDVTMSIEAEFSDFISPQVKGAPPGNATRKFISKIRVKNEEMIVIGGLEEVSRSQTGSGIPFLSRIPLLKWLFSSKTKDKTDNKLLIFIKPTVVY